MTILAKSKKQRKNVIKPKLTQNSKAIQNVGTYTILSLGRYSYHWTIIIAPRLDMKVTCIIIISFIHTRY